MILDKPFWVCFGTTMLIFWSLLLAFASFGTVLWLLVLIVFSGAVGTLLGALICVFCEIA